jgi:hypothetical protein
MTCDQARLFSALASCQLFPGASPGASLLAPNAVSAAGWTLLLALTLMLMLTPPPPLWLASTSSGLRPLALRSDVFRDLAGRTAADDVLRRILRFVWRCDAWRRGAPK